MNSSEACIGVIGIQDICHFTSRDIGYYPFYFQGYRILCSISGILCFLTKYKKNQKKTVKVPLKDESLKRNVYQKDFFDLHNLTVLMASFYRQQEEDFQKCLERSQPVSIVRVLKKLLRSGAL